MKKRLSFRRTTLAQGGIPRDNPRHSERSPTCEQQVGRSEESLEVNHWIPIFFLKSRQSPCNPFTYQQHHCAPLHISYFPHRCPEFTHNSKSFEINKGETERRWRRLNGFSQIKTHKVRKESHSFSRASQNWGKGLGWLTRTISCKYTTFFTDFQIYFKEKWK